MSEGTTDFEVTARVNFRTYLGGTFAAVFEDYPNIPHSVYCGELSYANEQFGFTGNYDATHPVSTIIVESVSHLSEAVDVNGFYVGMSSQETEAFITASAYTA